MDLMTRRRSICRSSDSGEYTLLSKVVTICPYGINTNYTPTSNTSVEIKYKQTVNTPSAHILACENYYVLAPRSLAYRLGTSSGVLRSLYNELVEISCYRHGSDNILVNGQIFATLAAGNKSANNKFSLFTYDMNIGNTYSFIGEFYYARIYDNDVLIRNYIPAKDSQGRIGVLETISNDFWYGTDQNPAFSE